MTRSSLNRVRAISLLLCMCSSVPASLRATAQTDQSSETQLLNKAHALEVRGHMEMAKQVWQQVLNGNSNQPEALAGMARADKLENHLPESEEYLKRLRAVNPNDPNIQRIETMGTAEDDAGKLQEASRLGQAHQYARAMTLLREVYGSNPPPGDDALSYYQTEAGTDDGGPQAIAGLRALMDKYPQDSRYQVTLGKILTYNPRTRAEGRKLLARHPNDPEAQAAMQQSFEWDRERPGATPDRRAYAQPSPEQYPYGQAAGGMVPDQTSVPRPVSGRDRRRGRPSGQITPGQPGGRVYVHTQNAEERAAYRALNAKKMALAESLFKALRDRHPKDAQAAAGLGYVRMSQSNFSGAISFFEQAEEDGDRDRAVEKALRDSRFFFVMQTATAALDANNLPVAEQEFREALTKRPNDPSALQGLGGTLLKGQQNDRAVEVYAIYVRVAPNDSAAWGGLFMAESSAGRYTEALETEHRIPSAIKKDLLRDPDYLRTLASTYLALGREADAERVLTAALELPFPANGAGMKLGVQLQYAALLAAAHHYEQAIGLYKQVLAQDPKNANAWVGLVQAEHQTGQDAAAYEAIRTMPRDSYAGAMQEAGFETTVAAVYESQGNDTLAQQVLEQLLANRKAMGKQPFVPAEIQLAGLSMRHGNAAHAYALYRSILEDNPGNAVAWSGLLGALHATGHDTEAMAQLQAIPPGVRKDLDDNPAYLQAVGSVYASLGDSQNAARFLAQAEAHYASAHVRPPTDLDVQNAWLLYGTHSDQALLRHLLMLGDRKDLSDAQRLTVQTIWANFAVRRANQASAAGNSRLAIAILNAAAKTFGNNPDVLRILATGYASAGLPREAVAIFKAQNLNTASAADYRGAVGAALAANDLRDAETWLRFGLDQYSTDSQMMILAAHFEAARGDSHRASQYYRAALAAMPPENPGSQLAGEMAQQPPQSDRLPSREQPRDLATLLGQSDSGSRRPTPAMPYLPSYTGGTGTMPTPTNESSGYGQPSGPGVGAGYGPNVSLPDMAGMGMDLGTVEPSVGVTTSGAGGQPDLGGYPAVVPSAQPSSKRPSGTPSPTPTLKDYTPGQPQARLQPAALGASPVQLARGGKTIYLHADRAVEAKLGPYVAYDPAMGIPHFVGAPTGLGDGVVTPVRRGSSEAPSATAKVVSAMAYARMDEGAVLRTVRFGPAQAAQQAQPAQAPMFSPRPNLAATQTAADGTPIVPYAAPARPAAKPAARRQTVTRRPSAAVQARAAAIRQNQASAPAQMSGVSQPPAEVYDTAPVLSNAQYTTYDYQSGQSQAGQLPQGQSPQGQVQQGQPPQGQVAQPGRPPQQGGYPQGGYSPSSPQYGGQYSQQQPQQTGDTYGQQYPQPGTGNSSKGRHHARKQPKKPQAEPAPVETPVAPKRQAEPMPYPAVGQPMENVGPPQVGLPYPLGQAPSDYQLQQRNLPPLRAYYDPRADLRRPLTEREQAELGYAQIEGGYSNWLGASVIGRYRSGTPGVDRLASLEIPFEASFVVDNAFRLSIIPKAVFLNSGTLNTAAGTLGTGPILGTYLANAPNNPNQQFASGVGGEVQLTTNTLALAIGTTPFEFLVTNLIGRGQWRPANGHFTLYGGRDPVEETQLSYAGLRDPGTATTTYGGNVWGGVVLTGGGVRFEAGDEHAGMYAQGEGGVLTGYHVLQNQKYDGLLGAYFRVKQWPEYGALNIGGLLYGEHFTYNERGETYGLGGYFSPNAYFLAAVPLTFNGHYGTDLHYTINGSLGVQTFQEDNENYFPLDPGLMAVAGCTAAQLTNHTCGLPVNSNTGVNFSVDSEVSYRVNEHWYVGGFLSANNTNSYDTVSGGFFARYTFRPQYSTTEYPTGLFPVRGFRPLRVP